MVDTLFVQYAEYTKFWTLQACFPFLYCCRNFLPNVVYCNTATFFLLYCTIILHMYLVNEYASFFMLFGNTWPRFCTLCLAVAAVNHTGAILRLLQPKRTGTISLRARGIMDNDTCHNL